MKVYLTCTENGHNKFYTIDEVSGGCMVTYGKIGTEGTKIFKASSLEKLKAEKLQKGYVEVGTTVTAGSTVPIQLANKLEIAKVSKYKVSNWYASPKLDGIRAIYYNGKFYSRKEKPFAGFEHVEKELKLLCAKHNLTLIDGELYSDTIPFGEIQGAVMQKVNIDESRKEAIYFNVFACVGKNITDTSSMIDVLNLFEGKYIRIVPYTLISNDRSIIEAKAKEYVKQGYEGIMLRSTTQSFDSKRSNMLLKFKFFKEHDFTVTKLIEGKGKYVGMLGKVVVTGVIKGKTIVSEVGSGFTDEQRHLFWDSNDLIGKTIEVKYQEVTPKNSLRFPTFLKTKEDR